MTDCTFVVEHLDATNKKALYRRAHAYKTQRKFEEAARDLQAIMKAHGEEDDLKAELKTCMAQMLQQKKQAAEEAKQREAERAARPKVVEVEPPAFKKIQIEEDSEDSDDAAALATQKQASSEERKRKSRFDPATLEAAQGRAMEEQTQRVMSQVPKTAAGFNRDFKALKKNTEQQMAFL